MTTAEIMGRLGAAELIQNNMDEAAVTMATAYGARYIRELLDVGEQVTEFVREHGVTAPPTVSECMALIEYWAFQHPGGHYGFWNVARDLGTVAQRADSRYAKNIASILRRYGMIETKLLYDGRPVKAVRELAQDNFNPMAWPLLRDRTDLVQVLVDCVGGEAWINVLRKDLREG